MHAFDSPHQFLLACALAPPGLDLSSAWRRLAGLGDTEALARSARLNQLRPRLAAHLEGAGDFFPPGSPGRIEVEDAARAHGGHGRLMAAELIGALGALQGAGIAAVPFKGPALATFIGEGAHSREMTDLDILIDPRDISRSAEALATIGYEASLPTQAIASRWLTNATNELVLTGPRGATTLELHWRLAPSWCPAAVGAAHVLSRARPRTFFGASVLWPRDEDLLLLHIADAMKSGGAGMRWMGDLAAMLRACRPDWQQLRDIAFACGGLDSVRVALTVVEGVSREVADALALEPLAIILPQDARPLSRETHSSARLTRAVRSVRRRLADDSRVNGAWSHFLWALQISDRPAQTSRAITRYLLGPAPADLASMPASGMPELALRLRAFRRRVGLAG